MRIARWMMAMAMTGLFLGCVGTMSEDEGTAMEREHIGTTGDVSPDAPTEEVCEAVCDFYGWDSASCASCWKSCVSCGPLGGLSEQPLESQQTPRGEAELESTCPTPPDSYGACSGRLHCQKICEIATGYWGGACFEGCCYCAALP